jgi:hypothetical protein
VAQHAGAGAASVAALFDDVESGFHEARLPDDVRRSPRRGGALSRPILPRLRELGRRREVTVDRRAFTSLLEREGELARVRPRSICNLDGGDRRPRQQAHDRRCCLSSRNDQQASRRCRS